MHFGSGNNWDKEGYSKHMTAKLLDTFQNWSKSNKTAFPVFQYSNDVLIENFNQHCRENRIPTQTIAVVKEDVSCSGPRYSPRLTLVASAWFPSQDKVAWIDLPSNSKDRSNVFEAPVPKFHKKANGERVNFTEKSVEVEMKLIQNHCYPNKVVVSLFSGSGTTAEAAFRSGCSSINIDKDYTQLNYAIRRLQKSFHVSDAQSSSSSSSSSVSSASSSSTMSQICAVCSENIEPSAIVRRCLSCGGVMHGSVDVQCGVQFPVGPDDVGYVCSDKCQEALLIPLPESSVAFGPVSTESEAETTLSGSIQDNGKDEVA
jgi:hypothetical protein